MSTCEYKYSLQDNLDATKELLKIKNKRKTNIVTLFVLLLSMFGIMASIGSIIKGDKNWVIGIISVVLLVGYFLVDAFAIKMQLKKQIDFYNSSSLKDVTKVKIELENNMISEIFYIKEKVHGTNKYSVDELTTIKFDADNIYLIFNNESIVLLKKAVMTEKNLQNFTNLKEKFKKNTK